MDGAAATSPRPDTEQSDWRFVDGEGDLDDVDDAFMEHELWWSSPSAQSDDTLSTGTTPWHERTGAVQWTAPGSGSADAVHVCPGDGLGALAMTAATPHGSAPMPQASSGHGPDTPSGKRPRLVGSSSAGRSSASARRLHCHTLTAEQAYARMMNEQERSRVTHLPDSHGHLFFKEPLLMTTRKRGSDKWHSQGQSSDANYTIGRFVKSSEPVQLLPKYQKCTGSEGLGTIEMTRKHINIRRRDARGSTLPRVVLADEWRLTYQFDQRSFEPEPYPYRLFHVHPPEADEMATLSGAAQIDRSSGDRSATQLKQPAGQMATTLSSPVQNEQSGGDLSVPLLEQRASEAHEHESVPNVSFTQHGVDAGQQLQLGEISYSSNGLEVKSANCTFAEYYEALDYDELPFNEGDVVGIHCASHKQKISRQTDGAIQYGIISKHAVVAGALDRQKERVSARVAYLGRTYVRTSGRVREGEFLVPSGKHDGTAIAVPRQSGTETLGMALEDAEEAGKVAVYVHALPTAPDGSPIENFSNMMRASGDKHRQERSCVHAKSVAAALAIVVIITLIVTPGGDAVHAVPFQSNVNTHCQTEQISTMAIGHCRNCHGRDAVVTFNGEMAQETTDWKTVAICPTGFAGSLHRTCENGNWSAPQGYCVRLMCAAAEMNLTATAGPNSLRTVTFNPTTEGSMATVPCPHPGFTGTLTRRCLPNSSQWGDTMGDCTENTCDESKVTTDMLVSPWPGNSSSFKRTKLALDIPRSQYGTTVQVSCCRQFTMTGSCSDSVADAGFVAMNCGSTGGFFNVLEGGTFESAASYEGARMPQSPERAAELFALFVNSARAAVQSPPADTSWTLPSNGVFGSITIGLEGERREVFSTKYSPMERSLDAAAIEISPSHTNATTGALSSRILRAKGRAAAAFARVACKELGYEEAPVVTNCQGLIYFVEDMQSENRAGSNTLSEMLSDLCPEYRVGEESTECPNWFEVRDPPLSDSTNTQMRWVEANARTPDHSGEVARFAGNQKLPTWQHSIDQVGPIPESPSCDGTEDSVIRCFQHQMVIPHKVRKGWRRACSRRMLVACARPARVDATTTRKQQTTSSGNTKHKTTWVIGDSVDSRAPSSLQHPKIFQEVGGPVDCRKGTLATDDQIEQGVQNLCWGTVLGDNTR